MRTTTKHAGFTIVEIIIVIVVIGILSAIGLVVYQNVSARARDSVRKQDFSNLAKIINQEMLENDGANLANCGGYNNAGSGWLNYGVGGSGSYSKSVADCLGTKIMDPSKCARSYVNTSCDMTYMKYTCPRDSAQTFNTPTDTPGETWTTLYTRLEALPAGQRNFPKQVCFNSGSQAVTNSYGMNYAINIGDPGNAEILYP